MKPKIQLNEIQSHEKDDKVLCQILYNGEEVGFKQTDINNHDTIFRWLEKNETHRQFLSCNMENGSIEDIPSDDNYWLIVWVNEDNVIESAIDFHIKLKEFITQHEIR